MPIYLLGLIAYIDFNNNANNQIKTSMEIPIEFEEIIKSSIEGVSDGINSTTAASEFITTQLKELGKKVSSPDGNPAMSKIHGHTIVGYCEKLESLQSVYNKLIEAEVELAVIAGIQINRD